MLSVGFIREVKFPEWLANIVVVPKKGGKWLVCVDYTDLNEACSKDSFPLPRIDHIVDASARHGMLSFLDAFSGYHQIPMHSLDVEKAAFIPPHGLYCYNVMPFGLKNVGATYQRLVTKIFQPLIGRTMEVYIDYMLVKSKEHPDHTEHLEETRQLWLVDSECGWRFMPDGSRPGVATQSPNWRSHRASYTKLNMKRL